MIKRVRLEPEAERELDAAVAWYDAASLALRVGDELMDAMDDAIARISERPQSFALAPGVPERVGARRWRDRLRGH